MRSFGSAQARTLNQQEIEALKKACLVEVEGHPALTALKEFGEFCEILARPEHHIMIPSNQYIETQVNSYSTQEMSNQMAQELANLPRFTAYARVIQGIEN
jgi:hypothetical protein